MNQIAENDKTILKNKLNLFDISIYEDVIPNWIFKRGESYFLDGKIKFIDKKNNTYNLIAKGTKEYKVLIKFNNDDKIDSAKCSCPYYKKENKYCKHIAGAIYSIKCSNNHDIITNEINATLKDAENIKNRFEKLIKEKKYMVNNKDDIYNSFYHNYTNVINKKDNQLLESELLSILCDLKNKTRVLHFAYNKLSKDKEIKKKNSNIFLGVIKAIYTVISSIIKAIVSLFMVIVNISKKDDAAYKDKKSSLFNLLEPWQQDLVNKGEYDETSFEEEGPYEDDDYYNEDE